MLSLANSRAKVPLMSPQEMISKAEVIAVVDLTKVDWLCTKGGYLPYSQRVSFKPINVLKGNLSGKQYIYGGGSPGACHFTHLLPGRHLVFLQVDKGGELVGCNYQLSVCPIREGMIAWYAKNSPGSSTNMNIAFDFGPFLHPEKLPLSLVLQQIENQITEDTKIDQWPECLQQLLSQSILDLGIGGDMPAYDQRNSWKDTWGDWKRSRDAFIATRKLGQSAREPLEIIFRRGSAAARLYAAVLMRAFDNNRGTKMLAELEQDQSPISVRYYEAHLTDETTVGKISQEILKTGAYTGFPARFLSP